MSDREFIVNFLEKAERRARSNKRFNDIAISLALAMVVPVVFKLLDLFFLFRGRTVIAFLGLWAVATVVWILIRMRGKSPLSQVAGQIDNKAQLHDQLKTAYWFAQNPRPSDWVDTQLRHSVKTTEKLRLDSLYPRRFPRASYLIGGLVFLLVALNFIPLSLNYNWIYLQAAPPFRLTDVERASLDKALKLLEKAKGAENAVIAQKIQEVINDLEQGQISEEEANKRLAEIQQQLEAGDLDAENVGNGLSQMAAILRQAKQFQQAAQEMGKGDLAEAANQIQALNQRLETVPAGDVRDMAERLSQASERPRSGLQDLAKSFEMTSAALQRGDRAASHSGFDRITRELQDLAQQLEDQKLRSEAADELGDLVDQLDGDQQSVSGATSQNGKSNNQNKAGQPGEQGKGETGETGDAQSGQSPEQAGEGQPGENGEQGQEGQPGDNPGGLSDDNPNGKGGNSFGGSTKSAPLEGEATSLEVQLEKEALKVDAEAPGSSEANKDVEAAGERERSKLDYRNAPSDLTPAQKDLLSQDHIPWERRQLIKNYFQAVKPTQTK
jgi:hypothetical protein